MATGGKTGACEGIDDGGGAGCGLFALEFDRLAVWFQISLGISPAPGDFCTISGIFGGGGKVSEG